MTRLPPGSLELPKHEARDLARATCYFCHRTIERGERLANGMHLECAEDAREEEREAELSILGARECEG